MIYCYDVSIIDFEQVNTTLIVIIFNVTTFGRLYITYLNWTFFNLVIGKSSILNYISINSIKR